MKNAQFLCREKYLSPQVDLTEIEVEAGFAITGGMETIDLNPDVW